MMSNPYRYHVVIHRTSSQTGRPLVPLTVLRTNDLVEAEAERITREARWADSPSLRRRNRIVIEEFPTL